MILSKGSSDLTLPKKKKAEVSYLIEGVTIFVFQIKILSGPAGENLTWPFCPTIWKVGNRYCSFIRSSSSLLHREATHRQSMSSWLSVCLNKPTLNIPVERTTTLRIALCIVEVDLKEQVEGSHNMFDTYETVVARAQLALVSIKGHVHWEKAIFFLIFVVTKCEHWIRFSMNPSGRDVAFTFVPI